MRTMTRDAHVISPPEKSLILNRLCAEIECLCDNGELILSPDSPIFINLDSEEIVYGKGGSCRSIHVNTVTGEICSWSPVSKKVWKTSSTKTEFIGSLSHGNLLQVDQDDHLYVK